MKRTPEISISLNGYDCTGQDTTTTAADLDLIAEIFRDAAAAIRAKQHGAFDCPMLLHIGVDFGGSFNERTGLPVLKCYRRSGR